MIKWMHTVIQGYRS